MNKLMQKKYFCLLKTSVPNKFIKENFCFGRDTSSNDSSATHKIKNQFGFEKVNSFEKQEKGNQVMNR